MSSTGEITLTANGKHIEPAGVSNYIYAYELKFPVSITLRKNGANVGEYRLDRLGLLPSKDFDEFIVENLAAEDNPMEIWFSDGDYVPAADRANIGLDDSTPIKVNMTNGSISVSSSIPNDLRSIPDGTASATRSVLAGASTTSLEVVIAIPADQTNGIRWGDSSITSTQGAWLGPGMSKVVSLENSDINIIRDGGSDVVVTCTMLERV